MTERACPFCTPDTERVFYRGENVLALWDAYPVSDGHALIITKRHVPTWFDASREEQTELLSALAIAKEAISSKHLPDGYNIGVNVGESAGQTVHHLHVHLIPRYKNDVQDPRGGVRHVIPSRANYLKPSASAQPDRVADTGPFPLEPAQPITRLRQPVRRSLDEGGLASSLCSGISLGVLAAILQRPDEARVVLLNCESIPVEELGSKETRGERTISRRLESVRKLFHERSGDALPLKPIRHHDLIHVSGFGFEIHLVEQTTDEVPSLADSH